MERRGFLAGLLATPILAAFRPVKEKELVDVKPNIMPDDYPMASNIAICHCSGILPINKKKRNKS